MSNKIELYVSQGSYHAGWDHLNQHEYLGGAKVLAKRNESWSDDYENTQHTRRVVVGRWFNPKDVAQVQAVERAIGRTFDVQCRCEHDCCGHWNGWGSAQHVKGREFLVRASYGANC